MSSVGSGRSPRAKRPLLREVRSLGDVAAAQAQLINLTRSGNVFGEVGERVAQAITGSVGFRGKGRDLLAPAPPGFQRPPPIGLAAPGPVRTPYDSVVATWAPRDQARYHAWLENLGLLGEVKTRQFDRRFDDGQVLHTRGGGGPNSPFFPLVDFYVLIIIGLDGRIVMARRLDLDVMVDYVASKVPGCGSWNYKVAIHALMEHGTDLTTAAREALAEPL